MNETLRAALVIARRDFSALIRSRSFILFLLGPVIMLAIGLAAGGVGSRMAKEPALAAVAVAMPAADMSRLREAEGRIRPALERLPVLERAHGDDPDAILRDGRHDALLSGSLADPVLHVPANAAPGLVEAMRLLVQTARHGQDDPPVPVETHRAAAAPAPVGIDRGPTAQLGQMVLFLATMLLAGMVLSNLVEEKANKIIEILAASIPMESIFLGKLFAMLAMALIAIAVWVAFGAGLALLAGSAMPQVAAPAVGWPLFLLLGFAYFSAAYLLLGSLYLGIGAMAPTVRDVQTLSMPVSMAQVGVFLFANFAMASPGGMVDMAARIFPFSSPFAMMAQAAESPALWPHLLALLWQGLCVWAIILAGTRIFRRHVMKSGGRRRGRRAGPERARAPAKAGTRSR